MQKMILLAMNVAPCPKRICNLHSALASYKRIQPNNFMVWHNLDLAFACPCQQGCEVPPHLQAASLPDLAI
jgi:hypothetical protein